MILQKTATLSLLVTLGLFMETSAAAGQNTTIGAQHTPLASSSTPQDLTSQVQQFKPLPAFRVGDPIPADPTYQWPKNAAQESGDGDPNTAFVNF